MFKHDLCLGHADTAFGMELHGGAAWGVASPNGIKGLISTL